MKLTQIEKDLMVIADDLAIRTDGLVVDDVAGICDFSQMWASTALGFGGCGGSAMTIARTYVVFPYDEDTAYVYFNGRFAYEVHQPNERFFEDIHNHHMASVMESGRYKS